MQSLKVRPDRHASRCPVPDSNISGHLEHVTSHIPRLRLWHRVAKRRLARVVKVRVIRIFRMSGYILSAYMFAVLVSQNHVLILASADMQ